MLFIMSHLKLKLILAKSFLIAICIQSLLKLEKGHYVNNITGNQCYHTSFHTNYFVLWDSTINNLPFLPRSKKKNITMPSRPGSSRFRSLFNAHSHCICFQYLFLSRFIAYKRTFLHILAFMAVSQLALSSSSRHPPSWAEPCLFLAKIPEPQCIVEREPVPARAVASLLHIQVCWPVGYSMHTRCIRRRRSHRWMIPPNQGDSEVNRSAEPVACVGLLG